VDIGHRGVELLATALAAGTAMLGPASLPHFLQAASYLQVCPPCHLGAALRAPQHAIMYMQHQSAVQQW
jgi:hypothetical protein